MKLVTRKNLLGVYDLVLAAGAIYMGIMMIRSNSGIFLTYPKDWLTKAPFTSWVVPGIITILLFGLGNLAAAVVAFFIKSDKVWVVSGAMGLILLLGLTAQIIVLGEWYLATLQFSNLSIIQLVLSFNVFIYLRKSNKNRYA